MSMAMAVRLVLGLICGLVLTWLVWDRSERELAERWDEEHLRPRFLPFSGSYAVCQEHSQGGLEGSRPNHGLFGRLMICLTELM